MTQRQTTARRPTTIEIMKRETVTLPADMVMFLVENEAEIQAVYDGHDARRDGVLEASKALEVRLGEFDSLEAANADLAECDADYAVRVESLFGNDTLECSRVCYADCFERR